MKIQLPNITIFIKNQEPVPLILFTRNKSGANSLLWHCNTKVIIVFTRNKSGQTVLYNITIMPRKLCLPAINLAQTVDCV